MSGGRLPAVPALARIRSEDAPVRWAAFYIVKAGLLSRVSRLLLCQIAVRRCHSFLTSKSPMIPITTSKTLHVALMVFASMVRPVFGNGFLDTLAARFRQSGKRTADASDFCLPEHQGLVHPLARAVELDESSMVDHPVDHRGGKLVVAQDRSPFAELDVGGEHHASLLVAC